MELDLSQLDELDLEEGLEVDLDEQESDLERRGGGSKKERSQYYPGRGRSYVRLLSVLVMGDDGKPSIKIFLKVETHTAKKTGLKDDKGRKVNLACFPGCHVCGRRQKTGKVLEKIIGKDNAWKGDLIKSLFPEEHHWGVVQLLEDSGTCQTCHDIESLRTNCTDCGGSGWKDSKRQKKEGYVNGHLYQARFEFGKPKMYQKVMDWNRDPDLGASVFDLKAGYDLIFIVSASERNPKWNEYGIDIRKQPSRAGTWTATTGDPKKKSEQKKVLAFDVRETGWVRKSDGERLTGDAAVREMLKEASLLMHNLPELALRRRDQEGKMLSEGGLAAMKRGDDESQDDFDKRYAAAEELSESYKKKVALFDAALDRAVQKIKEKKSGKKEEKSDKKPDPPKETKKDDVSEDRSYTKPPETKVDPPAEQKSDPAPQPPVDPTPDGPVVTVEDLGSRLPGPGVGVKMKVKSGDGDFTESVIRTPVSLNVIRETDGKRACFGLYFRRPPGEGHQECMSRCDATTVMRDCLKNQIDRKKVGIVTG